MTTKGWCSANRNRVLRIEGSAATNRYSLTANSSSGKKDVWFGKSIVS